MEVFALRNMMKLFNSDLRKMTGNMDPTTTSWFVSGLGLVVSALGARMLRKRYGAGILGFGLAHIILGQLDRMRVKDN
jgi:hypothetical protein